MKRKRNLYYLADIISIQTQTDQKLVLCFLNQFFKEIERELMDSSAVKIDNFGILRIIKSLSGDRLLFLGKFENDTVSPRMADSPQVDNDSALSDETSHSASLETWPSDATKSSEESKKIGTYESTMASKPEEESEDLLFAAEKKQAKRKKILRKVKIFTLFIATIIIVVGIIYKLYGSSTDAENQQFSPFVPIFTELNNSDTASFSHVIRIVGPNADFYSLSKIYYLHEQFWPYIYNANEAVVSGPFEIPEGAIIKIPKLDAELIDYKNPSSVRKAKTLVDEIINSNTLNTTSAY